MILLLLLKKMGTDQFETNNHDESPIDAARNGFFAQATFYNFMHDTEQLVMRDRNECSLKCKQREVGNRFCYDIKANVL